MHEMSLCEGVLKVIEEQARVQNFSVVRRVKLEIGELSSAEPDAMELCFEAVKSSSIAAGAVLEMVRTPGRGRCRNCGTEARLVHRFDPCPECGAYGLQVTDGDAMRIMELEVD